MLERLINAANSIGDHVHALIIVGGGATVALLGHKDTGEALVAAGLAMWKGSSK